MTPSNLAKITSNFKTWIPMASYTQMKAAKASERRELKMPHFVTP